MIHDVTIPFSFDTSPIEAQLASIGEREVGKVIESVTKQGIYGVMPKKGGYGYYNSGKPKSDDEIDWRKFIEDRFAKWLDSHAQEVIDEAALLLAARVGRKKAWREVLAELKEESDGYTDIELFMKENK